MVRGVVKFYKADQGWGAISSAERSAGRDAFVHFSVIEADPDTYRSLDAGDVVDVDYQAAEQDSSATAPPAPGSLTPGRCPHNRT